MAEDKIVTIIRGQRASDGEWETLYEGPPVTEFVFPEGVTAIEYRTVGPRTALPPGEWVYRFKGHYIG